MGRYRFTFFYCMYYDDAVEGPCGFSLAGRADKDTFMRLTGALGGRLMNKRTFHILVIAILTIVISFLHYVTTPGPGPLQSVYMDLYYIPVLLGALAFGLFGAALAYGGVLILYLPYIFITWHFNSLLLAEDILHTMFFGAFAVLAGLLVDRERRSRIRAEKDASLAALGRAAGTVAHELRSPLTVIAGFARHLKKKKGNAEMAIDMILDATQTMQKVVDSTLDFARPLHPTFEEGDIMAIVDRAATVCREKAGSRGISLTVTISPDPVRFAFDPFLCERALVNLIDNAIEASGQGQTVAISAAYRKAQVKIIVKDEGAGMDKPTLESLFTPFYTTKPSGTGIGMALTKRIIEGHQGTIGVESRPGRGTEVSVALPCGGERLTGGPESGKQ